MEQIILKVAEYGSVAGISVALVYLYFKYGQKQNGQKDGTQDVKITRLETLYETHCKANEEAFATIHNGLNSNTKVLSDLKNEVVKLATIIEERIQKK